MSQAPGCEHDWFRNGDPAHGCCLLCGIDEFPQKAADRLRLERDVLTSEIGRLRTALRYVLAPSTGGPNPVTAANELANAQVVARQALTEQSDDGV